MNSRSLLRSCRKYCHNTPLRRLLPGPDWNYSGVLIWDFWRRRLAGAGAESPAPRSRYERAVADFRHDKFCRMLSGAVIGLLLAHYLDMPSTVLLGLYPCVFMQLMDEFRVRELLGRCGVLLGGLVMGTLTMEIFQNLPILAAIVTFAVFFTVLRLFAAGIGVSFAYNFTFTYCLSSIYAGYRDSTMEQGITEYYLLQLLLICFIVWGCFSVFPAVRPQLCLRRVSPVKFQVPTWELSVYALVWLAIWLFFQFFEWKFALFAFLSFIGAFRVFERRQMKRVIGENVAAHVGSCGAAALFSILLFSLVGNVFIFAAGLFLLLTPFIYRSVYPPTPELAYRHNTMISGILVPLALYLGTDHAALFQSSMRARLIVLLMLMLYLVVEVIHHGKESAKFTRRMVRKLRT